MGLIVGAGVYAAFAAIDPWVIPHVAPQVWLMRAVVIGLLGLVFLFTLEKGFRRWFQPVVAGVIVVAGLGMVVILLIAPSLEREVYFGGIMLVTMAAYTYMKLRLVWAIGAAMLLWVAYDVADILIRETPLPLLVTNNLFLLATNVIGMFAGYHMELYIRRNFVQRRLIEEKDERLSRVLLNVLPASIAERLMSAPCTIAERFSSVTIMFSDIVHFTQYSSHTPPEELVAMLNEVFSAFDELVEKHGLEKIKTIGDAYMAAAGLPSLRDDHPEAVADFALDLHEVLARLNTSRAEPIHIRIGIHTGPVVAGVIGTKRFAYDLWGDAVNTASRMESHALPDTIQVSRATYERLRDRYELKRRGPVEIKGKGEMVTYILVGRKP
jgi:class 3 adenylate cyclase